MHADCYKSGLLIFAQASSIITFIYLFIYFYMKFYHSEGSNYLFFLNRLLSFGVCVVSGLITLGFCIVIGNLC